MYAKLKYRLSQKYWSVKVIDFGAKMKFAALGNCEQFEFDIYNFLWLEYDDDALHAGCGRV